MTLDYNQLDKLKENVGDSFYLLDTEKFKQNYDELLTAFQHIYANTQIAYSYKTNYTPRLCSIINQRGGYAEVVSEMEYDLALKVGVHPHRIVVNGPYKTKAALKKFILMGSMVNLDSHTEARLVEEIAKENSIREIAIGIRCNFTLREGFTSRFGIDCESPEFQELVKRLKQILNIKLRGLHCHFPDRNLESYKIRIEKMLNLIEKNFPEQLDYIDMGGGFFGKMEKELESQFTCTIPNYCDYAEAVAVPFRNYYQNFEEAFRPQLIIEPGTALVADVMMFVASIIEIKQIGNKTIAMSSGSKFNLGSFSSSLDMPMTVYHDPKINCDVIKMSSVDISGYTCIEADYLYKGYNGSMSIGDYIAFKNVGSYSVVFKPPFILPNVPVLEYNSSTKKFNIIKRKEELEDIFRTFVF